MRPALVVLAAFLALPASAQQTWNQWAGGPQHTGSLDVTGQSLTLELANIVVDPFVPMERAETNGSLLVHYQTPLSDGGAVFMEVKSGEYTGFRTWQTQTWNIRKFEWENGQLVTRWTAESDWKPAPSGGARFEPVFHSALRSDALFMAGAGGTILEVDRASGSIRARHGQFGETLDSRAYVTSPITIDGGGNLYYNVLRVSSEAAAWTTDHDGAWLVRIAMDGTATRVAYSALVTDAPAPTAPCTGEFPASSQPLPPSPGAVAPSVPCGSQRAGLNIAPAVGPDGTIYTVSRAHLNSRWGWVVAVNPDFTTKWSTSMRNRFNDGCNVLLPPNGTTGGCRAGTTTGVDPSDNQRGSGAVNDNSTSSPIVAPDGTIYYGAFSRYNHSAGHLMRFSSSGEFLSAYKFGWDVTPAIWRHDSTFSVITKENRYEGLGPRVPGDEEGFYITQLSPELNVEWQFKGTNTESCERLPDGTLSCVDNRPGGFEWCVNSLAVDRHGVVFVNSEDGHLYAIKQGGVLRERIFLQLTLGAAYTPLSLGVDGRIYTQNAGRLFVVGSNAKRRRSVR